MSTVASRMPMSTDAITALLERINRPPRARVITVKEKLATQQQQLEALQRKHGHDPREWSTWVVTPTGTINTTLGLFVASCCDTATAKHMTTLHNAQLLQKGRP